MGYKYLIFGNGFLGNKFNSFLDNSFISELEIREIDPVIEEINKYSPEIIINCVGRTGTPNIDWCEKNQSKTFHSNVLVPLIIAEACKRLNKKMVHIGSGCVYEGDNNGAGFSEEDEPNYFGSFYSETKIISEKLLKKFGCSSKDIIKAVKELVKL